MTTFHFIGTGLMVVSTVFSTALPVSAQDVAATYTTAEADRGAAVYAEQCAQCHGGDLSDGSAPALLGPTFRRTWSRPQVTVNDLYYIISTTMPPNRPGSLLEAQYREVLAHIMAENGVTAGAEPLPSEQRLLESISLIQPDDVALGTASAFIRGTRGFPQGTGPSVEELVTGSEDGSDWLYHTRDFSGTRYSPLSEITVDNVADLRPACLFQLTEVTNFQTGPIVSDGTIVLHGRALDGGDRRGHLPLALATRLGASGSHGMEQQPRCRNPGRLRGSRHVGRLPAGPRRGGRRSDVGPPGGGSVDR